MFTDYTLKGSGKYNWFFDATVTLFAASGEQDTLNKHFLDNINWKPTV